MNQQELFILLSNFTGQQNVVTLPRVFIEALDGDMECALFLGQLIYWQGKGADPEGWIYKSYEEWSNEIGISKYHAMKSAKKLKGLGLLETQVKKVNGNPTVHYKMLTEPLSIWLVKFLTKESQIFNEGKLKIKLTSIHNLQTKPTNNKRFFENNSKNQKTIKDAPNEIERKQYAELMRRIEEQVLNPEHNT